MFVGEKPRRSTVIAVGVGQQNAGEAGGLDSSGGQKVKDLRIWPAALDENGGAFGFEEVTVAIAAVSRLTTHDSRLVIEVVAQLP
jgi:hypothetical protein